MDHTTERNIEALRAALLRNEQRREDWRNRRIVLSNLEVHRLNREMAEDELHLLDLERMHAKRA